MRFVRGGEISDGELHILLSEDEEHRAVAKALSLLSYSDKSARALYLRLLREGFSREAATRALDYCRNMGYIRERDQLARLIVREANVNLRGPRYIREKLAAKGYSRADIDGVTEELVESGEVDFSQNLDRLCQKHGAKDEQERRALAYKYGFFGEI